MKEDSYRSDQIQQRNVTPPQDVPTTTEINQQSTTPAPSNIPNNNNQMNPMYWPNAGTLPPPYPPPPFAMGQDSTHYNNQTRSWEVGLFDCFSDIKISVLVLLCPCVAFGKIAEIVNEGETIWSEPGALYCFLYVIHIGFMEVVDLISYLIFRHQCFGTIGYEGCVIGFILATFYNGLYRTKMRRRWHLKGSLSSDYCLHLFCHQCALCQQYRQLEQQGFIVFQGWERNKEMYRLSLTGMYPQAPPTVQEMSR